MNKKDATSLTPLEHEVVALFIHLVNLLKLPRSVGEIYGLLFISTTPLSMNDLTRRLKLSKGSASQGLSLLRSIGAVREFYVPGNRRNHYVAETELRKLADGFIKEQLIPRLAQGKEQMGRIEDAWKALLPEEQKALKNRVNKLQSWQRQASVTLPILARLIHS